MFKRLFFKFEVADSFYKDINIEHLALYQHYFLKIVRLIDVANNTRWSRSETHDRTRLAADDATMEKIIIGEAACEGLSATYLQIMVNQYFFADTQFRERDQDTWVKRVLRRKSADYFPDGWSTRRLLEKVSG